MDIILSNAIADILASKQVHLGSLALVLFMTFLFRWFRKTSPDEALAKVNPQLTRDELIKRCRILLIDDQRPKLMDDLNKQGFAIDYDGTGDDTSKIEKNLYDLILLDFGGVGEQFGKDEGLSLLRHIRRVNPAPFILAYTSKSLTSAQSDFYRMTDATLSKDAGIEESFAKIEASLREALNLERIWKSLVAVGVRDEDSKKEMDRVLGKALKNRNVDLLAEHLRNRIGSSGKDELVDKLIVKMLELLGKAMSPK